jgi:hypothetical protein
MLRGFVDALAGIGYRGGNKEGDMKRILLMGLLIIGCGTAENGMGSEETPKDLRNHWAERRILGEWFFDIPDAYGNQKRLIFNDDHTLVSIDKRDAYTFGVWQISYAGKELELQSDSGNISFRHEGRSQRHHNVTIEQGTTGTATILFGRVVLSLQFGDKTVLLLRP